MSKKKKTGQQQLSSQKYIVIKARQLPIVECLITLDRKMMNMNTTKPFKLCVY
jgi:hypothetical protein